MNNEIKEILDDLNDKCKYVEDYGYQYKRLSLEDTDLLLDYITNLQENNDNQMKYIADLLVQITNLQQEIEKLNDDKRGMLVQLYKANDNRDKVKQENERLKEENNNKAMNDYAHAIDESWYRELYDDYKSRCEKAIEYINDMLYPIGTCVNGSDLPYESIESLLNILQNGGEDNE